MGASDKITMLHFLHVNTNIFGLTNFYLELLFYRFSIACCRRIEASN